MRYFLFIDESGEANITNPDPRFNIFVLCGILFKEDCYLLFDEEIKAIKNKFFSNPNVVFHSIKMRNKEGVYKVFQDEKVMTEFYKDIGKIFTNCDYNIISCVIDKDKYKVTYPFKNHAYEDSLTFLCERAILLIGRKNKQHRLYLCLEKRGNKKDVILKRYYTDFIRYGTQYISTDEFKMCHEKLHFRGKQENINGLQWADLCAYPIARKILSPDKPQPTFNLFENKIYCNARGEYRGLGLKFFP